MTYVRGLSAPHYQERNSYMDHATAMRDGFTLAQSILALIVRPFLLVTSAFTGVLATYVLYNLMRRRISAYRSLLRNIPGPGVHIGSRITLLVCRNWVRKYGHVLKFQSLL